MQTPDHGLRRHQIDSSSFTDSDTYYILILLPTPSRIFSLNLNNYKQFKTESVTLIMYMHIYILFYYFFLEKTV